MERKIKITGTSANMYDYFKENYTKHSHISKSKYVRVCNLINMKLSDAIVRKSLELKLPYRLGYIRIRSYNYKIKFTDGKLDVRRNAIDWNATRELWKELYPGKTMAELKNIPNKKIVIHTNEHSNSTLLKWYWDKRMCNVRNSMPYSFKAVKGEQNKEYYEKPDAYWYGRRGLAKWAKSEDRFNEYYM